MAKKRQPQPELLRAPRIIINSAILIGGAIGFGLQSYMNLDDINAFVLTGVCCFLAVFVANIGWLIYKRQGG